MLLYTRLFLAKTFVRKAISKDAEGVEHIDKEKCIYCGKCMQACPYGAIMERSKIIDIHKSISNPKKKKS